LLEKHPMSKATIGFIGLGIMGAPMAGHLLRGGHPLVVFNRTASKMRPLLAQGAQAGDSPQDVAARSDVVISMVSDSSDVEQVYLGERGVLAGARAGTLLIDMSTISPVIAVKVGQAAAHQGCPMLDAPVSGGDVGARNATLSIMVGGTAEVYERAKPIFELLGKPILCGAAGAGQTVKACNQIVTALHMLAMAEALTLANKAGVDPAIVLQVLSGGYAQSRILDVRGPKVVQGDFTPGFRSRLHYKDLNIVQETARAYGCSLPVSALAHELFGAMQANGWGELDHSAVIRVIELLAGVKPEA
jgi:2-hydroxy-3-oxopropionate reductase